MSGLVSALICVHICILLIFFLFSSYYFVFDSLLVAKVRNTTFQVDESNLHAEFGFLWEGKIIQVNFLSSDINCKQHRDT